MVGPMTFLELVNRAVKESKTTLDPLTSAGFADPPRTLLYTRFKDWVNDAYVELYNKRPEWYFRQERGMVTIYPRIYLTAVTTTIVPGDVLEAQATGNQVTVVAVWGHEAIENNAQTEITIDVLPVSGSHLHNLLVGETFDRLTPSADVAVATLRGVGRYGFEELQPGLHAINPETVYAHYLPAEAALRSQTFGSNKYPINYRDWYHWPLDYDMYPWSGEVPSFITQTPQGSFAIYPQPEEPMLLTFDYTRKLTEMVNATDIPEALPDDLHMYLVWRVVQEYADFDRSPEVFSRATKHVREYENILQRDYMPKFKWAPSKFNHG